MDSKRDLQSGNSISPKPSISAMQRFNMLYYYNTYVILLQHDVQKKQH